jgi:hypothetical protein
MPIANWCPGKDASALADANTNRQSEMTNPAMFLADSDAANQPRVYDATIREISHDIGFAIESPAEADDARAPYRSASVVTSTITITLPLSARRDRHAVG